jgi:hypothetical protein
MTIILRNESDNYGTYFSECIGIVDFFQMIKEQSLSSFFENKLHPNSFFPSNSFLRLSHTKSKELSLQDIGRFALFVPSDKVNTEWNSKPWTLKHNLGNKKRSLPISVSQKNIDKWLNNPFNENNSLTPNYFFEAKSITDLQTNIPESCELENIDLFNDFISFIP